MPVLPNSSEPPEKNSGMALKVSVAVLALIVLVLVAILGMPYLTGTPDNVATVPEKPAVTAPAKTATAPATPQAPRAQPGDCRPFEKTIEIGDQKKTLTGTTCMQQDGSWKIMAD